MKLSNSAYALGMIAVAAGIAACDPKPKTQIQYVEVIKEVQVQVPAPAGETPPGAETEKTAEETAPDGAQNVLLTGSLSLGTGLSLTGGMNLTETPQYALNCVTLSSGTETAAVRIDVESKDGGLKFSKDLGDVGGKSLGCFLLEGDTVLTSVIFGQNSNITPGAGEIVTTISYDAETKKAVAAVDLTRSTALSADAIAKAKQARGATETDISSLTGQYQVSCVAESGMPCDREGVATSIPSNVYVATETLTSGGAFASMWTTKDKHDRCVPAGSTESKPKFGLKFGATVADLDFKGPNELNSSMDAVFGTIKGSASTQLVALTKAVESSAVDRSKWRTDFCAQNIFTAANCKFMLAEYDSYSWTDPEGKTITNKYVKWVDGPTFSNAVNYGGVVNSEFIPCSEFWSPDKDICPAGVANSKGEGTVEAFFGTSDGTATGEKKRLRLVCAESGGGWPRYQQNALANTMAAAAAAAENAEGCTTVASGPFTGKREAYRNEVRNIISEIASFGMYSNGQSLCRHRGLPANFTFKDCAPIKTNALNYMYWEATKPSWITAAMEQTAQDEGLTYQRYDAADRGVLEFCREFNTGTIKNNFNVDPTTGRLINMTAGTSFSQWEGPELCPAHHAANPTTFDGQACATEFANLSAANQVSAFLKKRIGRWQPLAYVACSTTAPADKAYFDDLHANSCLPMAGMTMMCGSSGTCVANLRCHGTEGGKCYDSGSFVGRIPGRISSGALEKGMDGAFSITSAVKDSYMSWDSSANKMKLITLLNQSVLQGTLQKDSDDFSA